MSVERVKITRSGIVLKDASGNEKFNTSNYYLKTDPGGTLKAGGYLKTPMVYGQGGTVSNHDNGWYTSSIIDWVVDGNTGPSAMNIYVPKYDQLKIERTPMTAGGDQFPAPAQAFQFNGVNCGTFRYVGIVGSINPPDGEGSYTTDPYIDIVIDSIQASAQTGPSGYFTFPAPSANILTWSRLAYGSKAGYYTIPFWQYYRTYNKSGWVIYKNPRFRPFAIMTTANPVNLSIAVTP